MDARRDDEMVPFATGAATYKEAYERSGGKELPWLFTRARGRRRCASSIREWIAIDEIEPQSELFLKKLDIHLRRRVACA
jgi:hypothetical protein